MRGTKRHLMQWENTTKRKHGEEEPKGSTQPSATFDQSRCISRASPPLARALPIV